MADKKNPLDLLPQVHNRTFLVQQASSEIALAVIRIRNEKGLTALEEIQCLALAIAQTTKYAIRVERHPEDPDKPGDEA